MTAPAPSGSRTFIRTGIGTVAIAVASAGILGLAVVLPFLVSDFGFGPAIAGLVMPAVYIGCICTTIAGGRMADRWGGERIAALGLLVLAAGTSLACLAPDVRVYFLGALVAGMGYGIANPATSLMVDPGPAGGRGLLFGIKQAGVTLGGVLAGWLLPVLSTRFDWRIALAMVAACQLATCIGMLAIPRAQSRSRPRHVVEVDAGYKLKPYPGSLYGAGMAAAQISVFGLLVVYLTQLGMSPINAGLVYGGALAIALVARIVWGVVSDRKPADRSVPLRWCAALGMLGSLALAAPFPAFALTAAVFVGAGAAAWNGAYLASVISSAAASGQGASIGKALLLINIGCVAGPLTASGVLALTHNWILLWLVMAAVQAGSLVAVNRATVVGVRVAVA
jgi:MFS family permease